MMKTPSTLLPIVLGLFVLFAAGCARKDATAVATRSGDVEAVSANVPPSERSRIVTMDLSITVEHFDDALAQLRASVDRAGGYVSEMRSGGAPGEQTARLEIRVPADRAQGIRGSLTELGEVTNTNEKVEDVTEQRADLEARLANARLQEKRLLEIMSNRSGTIADLVETEREVARVREIVERLEAQQRSIKSKVDLATIHVSLATRSTLAWRTPGTSLYRAAKTGTEGAAAVAVYTGMAALTVAPLAVPVAIVVAAVVVVVRRRRASQLAALAG